MAHPFVDAPGPLRSINIARVVALPGDLATDDVVGRRGFELASGLWLGREVAAHATELGIDADSPRRFHDFAACLSDPDAAAPARKLASDIALRLGRRLGCLLLMLSRGEPANRAARPEWDDAQWRFWGGVRRVVIGGGLLAGAIGDVVVPAAQDVLDAHGCHARLDRSPWGDAIGLVGLARLLPLGADERAVLDFGQTSAKRGIASYRGGRVAALRVLPPRAGFCTAYVDLSTDAAEVGAQWDAMVNLAAETAEVIGSAAGEQRIEVSACLACYMTDGRPDAAGVRSCYGRLQVLGPDLAALGRGILEGRLGGPVRLDLWDDGSAAACAVDPEDDCVVLTVGTAIGVGFPVARHPRAPLAPGFRID